MTVPGGERGTWPAERDHPLPAVLARGGFIAVCSAICIPGFLVALPELALPASLSFGLFVFGLASLGASVFLSFVEGLDRGNQPWIPVLVLTISAIIPFLNAGASFPTDNRNWLITHLALIAIILSTQYFSYRFIAAVLRAGMVASLATLVGGAAALSVDERSLFLLDGRLRGVFGHANMTGLVAVAALLLALGSSRWKRLDLVLSVSVIAAATSLTSLFAAGVGLAVWFVRKPPTRLFVWVVGILSLFVPAAAVQILGSHLDPTLFTGRTAAWQWAMALDVPPFRGLGIGLFEALGSGKLVPWFHTHNQVIMDYVSGGWPLALATVLLLISVGYWAATSSDRRQLVMWSVLVLQCATEVPFVLNYPSGSMLSTAIILLLIVRARQRSNNISRARQPDGRMNSQIRRMKL